MTYNRSSWFSRKRLSGSRNKVYTESNMWNEDYSPVSSVNSLTVNSEFINRSKVVSPMSELKKTELKRSNSWAASVTERIRRRKNLLNKPAKGM